MRALAAVVVLACAAGIAHADSPKLAEAERAIETVHYDDAQRLLVAALADGNNSPAAVLRIYRLSGTTATVLGQRELAEQYYRRLLALDPNARLDDVAPRLQEPFVAAQAYMAAHGRFAATATRVDATTVVVAVEADPLAMAVAATVDGPPVRFDGNHRASVPVRSPAAVTVSLLDEHGNRLGEIGVGPASAPIIVAPPRSEPEERPFMRRWTTWAVPSGALLLAGAILGTIALDQNEQLKRDVDKSSEHFFTDVDGTYHSLRRNATIGIALAAAGAIVAIPAIVFYVNSRKPDDLSRFGGIAIAPTVDANGAGLVVLGSF